MPMFDTLPLNEACANSATGQRATFWALEGPCRAEAASSSSTASEFRCFFAAGFSASDCSVAQRVNH